MADGARYLLRGLGMWRRRPRMMALGMVPALLVLALLGGALVALGFQMDELTRWVTPFADDWDAQLARALRLVVGVVVFVAALVIAVLSFTGLTLLVGDPFYERIWAETERMLGGEVPDDQVGLVQAAVDGARLVLTGLLTGAVVLVLGLVPVIGTVVGLVLGLVVGGRVLGRELLSRPLGNRGLRRRAREELLRPHRRRVLGFGVATHACFLVPLGAIVVMPAAVVGATMLARDVLESADPSGSL